MPLFRGLCFNFQEEGEAMFFSGSEGYNYKHKRNVFGHKVTKILHQNIVLHSLSLSKYFFWENSPPKYFLN
jgi:hypothetical protein